MAASKSRLGRGLSGLISGGSQQKGKDAASKASAKSTAGKSQARAAEGKARAKSPKGKPAEPAPPPANAPELPGFKEIDISAIDRNPYQPRREFDEETLKELADSIRAEGLLQPIVVRKAGEKKYQLIAGERRWRACKLVGLKKIPVRLIDAGDASAASMSLIENLQRTNLNPMEEALGYASLMRDFDLTQEVVAERVGKGRATVANSLRLIQLHRDIQGYLAKGLISTGHAKVLLGLEAEQEQILLARRIIEDGLSVRALEKLVKNFKVRGASGNGDRPRGSAQESSAVRDIERQLATHLNTRIALKHTPKKGRIVIEYYGNDDLQRILEKIGVTG